MKDYVTGISLLLALIFGFAAVVKMFWFSDFTAGIGRLLPFRLVKYAQAIALGVVGLEGVLAIGLMFAAPPVAPWVAAGSAGTFIAFSYFVDIARRKRVPCGCFGKLSTKTATSADLRRNIYLALVSFVLVGARLTSISAAPPTLVTGRAVGFAVILLAVMVMVSRVHFAWGLGASEDGSRGVRVEEPAPVAPEQTEGRARARGSSRRDFLRFGVASMAGIGLAPMLTRVARGESTGTAGLGNPLDLAATGDLVARARQDPHVSQMDSHLASRDYVLDWAGSKGYEGMVIHDRFYPTVLRVPAAGGADLFWFPGLALLQGVPRLQSVDIVVGVLSKENTAVSLGSAGTLGVIELPPNPGDPLFFTWLRCRLDYPKCIAACVADDFLCRFGCWEVEGPDCDLTPCEDGFYACMADCEC